MHLHVGQFNKNRFLLFLCHLLHKTSNFFMNTKICGATYLLVQALNIISWYRRVSFSSRFLIQYVKAMYKHYLVVASPISLLKLWPIKVCYEYEFSFLSILFSFMFWHFSLLLNFGAMVSSNAMFNRLNRLFLLHIIS